ARPPVPVPAQAVGPTAERRAVAVLLVRAGFTGEDQAFAAHPAAPPLHDAVTAVAECVERFGGTVAGSLGYVSVAVFGLRADGARASHDAVRAALELRARLSGLPGTEGQTVVSAGDALIRRDPYDSARVSVVGRLVDEAHALLSAVPHGEIHLCGDAVRDTVGVVRHRPSARPGVRVVDGPAPAAAAVRSPLEDLSGGHGPERAILRRMLERSRRHDAPHLVTILGDPGVGKSRFLADVAEDLQGEPVRVVRVGVGDSHRWNALGVLTACCGMSASDAGDDRLTHVVRHVAGHGDTAERLLRRLRSVRDTTASLDGWCELLTLLAREQPLVLLLDDAHSAEDGLLDRVEQLVSTALDVPLFIVAAARPALLERRPFWGSGLRHSGTLTLERLPELGVAEAADPDWVRNLNSAA
ncbi:AAA family ATPase, partial [Streptomyces sp. TRM64462]|uniref:AAA family ATPase n=1 Tax=Streptomyces sp. TRM64462 TaxID=2741726 RepID=UPI001586E5AF